MLAFFDHELSSGKRFKERALVVARSIIVDRINILARNGRAIPFSRLYSIIERDERYYYEKYKSVRGHYELIRSNDAGENFVREIIVISHEFENYIIAYLINHKGEVFFGYVIINSYSQYFIFSQKQKVHGFSMRFMISNFDTSSKINVGDHTYCIALRNSDESFEAISTIANLKKIESIKELEYEEKGDVLRGIWRIKDLLPHADPCGENALSLGLVNIDPSETSHKALQPPVSVPTKYDLEQD
ncbi:MAG: hypothetical protein Kilf2KO_34950 [Rhodospirillales bacterium]